MKSFFLPVGRTAGASLTTIMAALSCGAAVPVAGLDILYLADGEPDPVLPLLADDLNRTHDLLSPAGRSALFPSSFIYNTCRPVLPSLGSLSGDPSSSALLAALRGKGQPLSYKTDREAVEWAFASMFPADSEDMAPFRAWTGRICASLEAKEETRVAVLCDLCDPFSSGAAFAVLRHLRQSLSVPHTSISFFCLAKKNVPPVESDTVFLSGALRSLDASGLVSAPDGSGASCADSLFLYSLPTALAHSEDSGRLACVAMARGLSRFLAGGKLPAPGLHTAELPGVLTLQSLGEEAKPFAAFIHASAWLLSDLLPALSSFFEHPAALRLLAPNTRNGLFRRLFRQGGSATAAPEELPVVERAFRAVLTEILSLIRSLPVSLRLAETADPIWKEAVDSCGRTVTVAAEYDVSKAEAEAAEILEIKPVHRVSLADTEEEKQLRRLDEIAAQLKEETETRDGVFARAGDFRALQALRDCRARCVSALEKARAQAEALSRDPEAEHLAITAAARRISLLEAAVARCDRDLSDPELIRRLSAAPAEAGPRSPFESQLLDARAAEKLFSLLTLSAGDAEPVCKEIRALLPALLPGFTLSDAKALLHELLSACKPDQSLPPLVSLLLSVYTVSMEETSSLHFLSSGSVPSVPLLPDLWPDKTPLSVSALLPLLPDADRESDPMGEKRGLLAFLLLRQYLRRTAEEPALSICEYTKSDSPVLRAWLSSRRSDRVCIVSLGTGDESLPFALILPGTDLLCVRITAAHAAELPAFARPWFDEEVHTFRDPCALLGEAGRALILDRVDAMLAAPSSFSGFLSAWREDLLRMQKPSALPEQLPLYLKAAFGLRLLPAFSDTLKRSVAAYEHFLPSDRIISCMLDIPDFPASACEGPNDIVYLYRGVPFARENSRTLMEGIPLPAANWILNMLSADCRTLSDASDDYHDVLVRELSLLLERCPDALPEARETALALLEKAGQPISDSVTELAWPWDPSSPAICTILTESLGNTLATLAASPFSDILALFPARGSDVIGDSLMASMCLLPPPDVRPDAEPTDTAAPVPPADAVLPPLSGAFTAALCRLPEGRTLLRPGFLSFSRAGEGSVKVTLTLEGRFPVRMIRTYAQEDILNLYAHDIPTLALWPGLPLPPEEWKAYYVYAGLPSGYSLSVYTASDETALTPDGPGRLVRRTENFPLAFSFFREGRPIGAVPNLLPPPRTEKKGPVAACVDFGSVGTSVVFSDSSGRRPLQGPTLVRTLVQHPAVSRDLLRKEFLPAVPVSALIPTVSRLFRNVPGAAPLPFEDGIILMSSDLQDVLSVPTGALYTSLKWEEEKGRSAELCLHQVMLMTALQARTDGASELYWRFAIPDEMAAAGRERLMNLFLSLAETVRLESGFPASEPLPSVMFAAESSALGAYFRFCASEDTRGGFMVLDIGACTADISLFLRGREQAVRTCQIPLGVHYMLLPTLLKDPELLSRELGTIQDPAFRRDLALLEKILRSAVSDASSLRHARLALDTFVADRLPFLLPALLYNPATGMPTRLGSVLLLHLGYLMMLSGLVLLQIAADPGKNDFLPEQMSLCLSGRGASLLEGLPDPVRTALWHFLTMFRNRRVASLSLLFSSEKKMEIPVGLSFLQETSAGLPPASAVPAAVSVRPEELLPQFLLRFRKEFPASAEMLFAGFFADDFYHPFSPYGESIVTAAITQSFTDRTALRPFDSLSAWIGALLDLLSSPAA